MGMSEATKFFISKCFKNGDAMIIQPMFNEKYNKYKFTEEILQEMIDSNKVRVMHQTKDSVSLMGVG